MQPVFSKRHEREGGGKSEKIVSPGKRGYDLANNVDTHVA